MKTRQWHFTDKSKWGEGPWQSEVDKIQWQDEKTGLPCLIVRGPVGNLCGYVGVAPEHKLYGIDYAGCTQSPVCSDYCEHSPSHALKVHGGLTFSDFCQENNEQSICHITEPGKNEHVWWFGFDCGHFMDFSPGFHMGLAEMAVYRTIDYVRKQVTKLAEQLAEQR